MTLLSRPGGARILRRTAPLLLAGAAMVLSGCVVPVPSSPQRQSSMLASNASCPSDSTVEARYDRPIDPAQPSHQLLTEALRDLVNRERCQRGAMPLGLSIAAIQAAGGHAGTMAKLNFMGHTSPVGGRETLKQRLAAENAGYRVAGENIARAPAASLSPRSGGCLAEAVGGAPAPTYATVANGLFQMWLSSAKHRANILEPRFRAFGAGIGVNQQKYNCGEVAAAMVLLG